MLTDQFSFSSHTRPLSASEVRLLQFSVIAARLSSLQVRCEIFTAAILKSCRCLLRLFVSTKDESTVRLRLEEATAETWHDEIEVHNSQNSKKRSE